MAIALPEEFSDLQSLVEDWALETRAERFKKRYTSSMEEIQDCYDKMMPKIEAIVAHLNQFPLDEIPEASRPLLYLSLTTIEISRAVELWKAPDNYAFPAERVHIDL
jgi:hypothetical protein